MFATQFVFSDLFQPFNQRVLKGQNVGNSLFHLKRFYVPRKTMYFTWLETLTHTLAAYPAQRESLVKIRGEMVRAAGFIGGH